MEERNDEAEKGAIFAVMSKWKEGCDGFAQVEISFFLNTEQNCLEVNNKVVKFQTRNKQGAYLT